MLCVYVFGEEKQRKGVEGKFNDDTDSHLGACHNYTATKRSQLTGMCFWERSDMLGVRR